MIVAASSACFPDTSLSEVLDHLADLEYTNTELVIGEQGTITLNDLMTQFDPIVRTCKMSRRINAVSLFFDVDPAQPEYLEQFTEACRLARALKLVVVSVHTSVPTTPYNEEVDRLLKLIHIAMHHGVVVGIITEAGRFTADPNMAGSLCKNVPGLGITLDPSHYVYDHSPPVEYESILPYVIHIRLRDTTEKQFQVRIGQGIIEFSRLVIQLNKVDYRRALCVDLAHIHEVDPLAELRKMRLLMESLL